MSSSWEPCLRRLSQSGFQPQGLEFLMVLRRSLRVQDHEIPGSLISPLRVPQTEKHDYALDHRLPTIEKIPLFCNDNPKLRVADGSGEFVTFFLVDGE